jgi:broad specificity phosphatase PhoE
MDHPATRIHFVRHGEVYNPQGVFYGRLPRFPLSVDGRHQARSVARLLEAQPVAAIYCSPMLRAQQTARAIAAYHPDLEVCTSRLLNEVYVPLQGRPLLEGVARDWDLYTGNKPPHETVEDILQRMLLFTQRARQQHVGQQVVAVTHGDPIGFLMLWSQRRPVTAETKAPLYQNYLAVGSITTLTFLTASTKETPALEYVVPYPGPARPI